jgi:hypothetical protein
VSSKEGLKVRTGDVLITNGSKQCWWNKKVGYFRKEDDGTVFPDGCMPVGHVFEFEYFCPVRRRIICPKPKIFYPRNYLGIAYERHLKQRKEMEELERRLLEDMDTVEVDLVKLKRAKYHR